MRRPWAKYHLSQKEDAHYAVDDMPYDLYAPPDGYWISNDAAGVPQDYPESYDDTSTEAYHAQGYAADNTDDEVEFSRPIRLKALISTRFVS